MHTSLVYELNHKDFEPLISPDLKPTFPGLFALPGKVGAPEIGILLLYQGESNWLLL